MGYRLACIQDRAALVDGELWYDVERISDGALSHDPMRLLAAPERLHELDASLHRHAPHGRLSDVRLDAPVPRPSKAFLVGLNYRSHAAESSKEPPEHPMIFAKLPNSITGPNADLLMRSGRCDYEGELVVVIGPGGKDISQVRAWSHVAGLTVGQDFSDRATQMLTPLQQTTLGKSYDTFGPTGPHLVSTDLLDRDDLHLMTHVNGEKRQDVRTSELIFSVPFLIAYLSRICSLNPGDMIFTGTPDGVGMPQGRFLAHGDVVTTTIDGIGTIRNRCLRIDAPADPPFSA